jgi:hypothetical protein
MAFIPRKPSYQVNSLGPNCPASGAHSKMGSDDMTVVADGWPVSTMCKPTRVAQKAPILMQFNAYNGLDEAIASRPIDAML